MQLRDKLNFPEITTRRRTPLWQVMPNIDGWRFLVVLCEMHVTLDGGQFTSPKTFDELAHLFGQDISEAALSVARSSGRLVEGRKALIGPLIDILATNSGAQVELIRHGFEGNSEVALGIPGNQLKSIQDEGDDETEICPASLQWYARFRNDDPFIFISADRALCAMIEKAAPDTSMLVSRDFIYAS